MRVSRYVTNAIHKYYPTLPSEWNQAVCLRANDRTKTHSLSQYPLETSVQRTQKPPTETLSLVVRPGHPAVAEQFLPLRLTGHSTPKIDRCESATKPPWKMRQSGTDGAEKKKEEKKDHQAD